MAEFPKDTRLPKLNLAPLNVQALASSNSILSQAFLRINFVKST